MKIDLRKFHLEQFGDKGWLDYCSGVEIDDDEYQDNDDGSGDVVDDVGSNDNGDGDDNNEVVIDVDDSGSGDVVDVVSSDGSDSDDEDRVLGQLYDEKQRRALVTFLHPTSPGMERKSYEGENDIRVALFGQVLTEFASVTVVGRDSSLPSRTDITGEEVKRAFFRGILANVPLPKCWVIGTKSLHTEMFSGRKGKFRSAPREQVGTEGLVMNHFVSWRKRVLEQKGGDKTGDKLLEFYHPDLLRLCFRNFGVACPCIHWVPPNSTTRHYSWPCGCEAPVVGMDDGDPNYESAYVVLPQLERRFVVPRVVTSKRKGSRSTGRKQGHTDKKYKRR